MVKSIVWGKGVLYAGFSQVPNRLLDHQHNQGLTNDELCLIILVFRYKHTKADPYPHNITIAERMQCSERTTERYTSSLKEKGLLRRDKILNWRYPWDFSMLMKKLQDLSEGECQKCHQPGCQHWHP